MDEEWAIRGAPDAQSAGHAVCVLAALQVRGMSPERYLMTHDGMSKAQAETLVAACRVQSWNDYYQSKLRMIFHGDD